VRVFTGRDGNGKRDRNKTIKGNKKDAETYLNATLTQISTGTFVEPLKLTVGEYLEKWLTTAAKPRLRERTFDDYSAKLESYVRPRIGAQRLSDLRPLDVQALYSEMAERDLSPRTIRYTHAILSSALKQAVRWNMLPRNPCDAVELPRIERKEMQALSANEVTKFLCAAQDDEYGTLFAFAIATGMRPEEYLPLVV
jgi:integrase